MECIAPKVDYTVIFEDFDRLGKKACIEIFTKLREINKLVNVRLSPENHMRFIYVFSEGIFDCTRQTKFFDYCLPVIPVLSAKNAAEELRLEYFDAIQIKNTYDIAEAAAPHLTDLRTVHSIINDYRIFEEIESHRNGKLSNEWKKELLAFMIYKNLEPQDYDNIRNNKSVVFHEAEGELAHKDLIAALKERNYLSGECLLFIGYSKEQMKLHYTEILQTRTYEEKKSNLDNDRKGLHLEIISEAAQDSIERRSLPYGASFSSLFCGIEFAFLDYLLNYLVNSDSLVEWQRSLLSNINIVLYDKVLFQYECSGHDPIDICDNSLQNLFWLFDEETTFQILRYLFITGYWSKGSFEWFFAAQTSTLPNATDENKVRSFLRFREALRQARLPVPDAVDTAARNWLGLFPVGKIETHWTGKSLIEMIVLLFSDNVSQKLQKVEVTIDGATSPVAIFLLQYFEEHYWDYTVEQRKRILLRIFRHYGRLPECFFTQKQQEPKYSTDENKIHDFLWLRHQIGNRTIFGDVYIPPSNHFSDSSNTSVKFDLDAALQSVDQPARQWLSSTGLTSGSVWETEDLSLPQMIDLLYPAPDTVPVQLKMVQLSIGNKEDIFVMDILDHYYTKNYWQYNDEKRIMILQDLVKNCYWNSSHNDSSWFFAVEDASDQDRLQDLLKLIGPSNAMIPTKFNDDIRDWVNSLIDLDIIQLIDYIYPYGVPTDVQKRELTIRDDKTHRENKKSIGTHLQDFKSLYR